VVRGAGDLPSDPAVVLNPDDDVTPQTFAAWLGRRQRGEPVDPGVTGSRDPGWDKSLRGGVTPVVIDASAGVELVADTIRGRALRTLVPPDAVPWGFTTRRRAERLLGISEGYKRYH